MRNCYPACPLPDMCLSASGHGDKLYWQRVPVNSDSVPVQSKVTLQRVTWWWQRCQLPVSPWDAGLFSAFAKGLLKGHETFTAVAQRCKAAFPLLWEVFWEHPKERLKAAGCSHAASRAESSAWFGSRRKVQHPICSLAYCSRFLASSKFCWVPPTSDRLKPRLLV